MADPERFTEEDRQKVTDLANLAFTSGLTTGAIVGALLGSNIGAGVGFLSFIGAIFFYGRLNRWFE